MFINFKAVGWLSTICLIMIGILVISAFYQEGRILYIIPFIVLLVFDFILGMRLERTKIITEDWKCYCTFRRNPLVSNVIICIQIALVILAYILNLIQIHYAEIIVICVIAFGFAYFSGDFINSKNDYRYKKTDSDW